MRVLVLLTVCALLAGCDDSAGPAGPSGPAGGSGPPGQDGQPGAAGLQGQPGKDAPDTGTGPANAAVHLVDMDSHAEIKAATVIANPGNVTATTDAGGRAMFANLPAGLYQFTVSAAGLKLTGTAVVADATRSMTSEWTPVYAGQTTAVELKLRRFDRSTLNLVALHAGTVGSPPVANPLYLEANCTACHNDRKAEIVGDGGVLTSDGGVLRPYHAMTTHASQGCLFCHGTVDLSTHSGATIRKQVNVKATCKVCHSAYPASF